ncbi:MAG: Gfo/Idh/MocA family oxidoreductase [Prevotellaceae bacterium]|jgi:virulence factor|nr:Gfo/Idh/MocA family oxidoreductase [Prevotellaceae bacterium]
MNALINIYKKMRTVRILGRDFTNKYAFVGIGNHSLHNLYPAIDSLKIRLKYIVCRSHRSLELISQNYPYLTGTTDFDTVLNDEEVKGVFICAAPAAHYQLTRQALLANKNVFVEKPVCTSSEELQRLIETEQASAGFCMVGMQKRYSPCTALLKRRLKKDRTITYSYRFRTGAFPEGDVFWDLFIHPIDYVLFMFGSAQILGITATKMDAGKVTLMMILKHEHGVIGNIEMSTHHFWAEASEELYVNAESGFYEMSNHQMLYHTVKPPILLSLPLEKVIKFTPQKRSLFNSHTFIPVFQNNQFVSQGYFGEIQAFASQSERQQAHNLSSLKSLVETYRIVELIRKQIEKRI